MRIAFVVFALLTAVPSWAAASAPDFKAETLTGDWNGARTRLYEQGVFWEFGYKGDMLRNFSGGRETGSRYTDNFDIKLRLDAEKLLGWDGTTVNFHVLSNHGGKFNQRNVGSVMGTDNIEVPVNTTKFFKAWVQKSFWEDKVSLLVGLYPIDSEFYVTDASGVFLHPSMGMSAEIAATANGQRAPSIFNTSSFGFRFKLQPDPAWYAQLAVVDGGPGDPDNPRGTHVRFKKGDGAMSIAEFGINPSEVFRWFKLPTGGKQEEKFESISKIAIGYWRYNPRFDDLLDTNPATGTPLRRVNSGAYFLAEQTVYTVPGDPARNLAVFMRHGVAEADVNRLAHSTSLGLRYKGMIVGRSDDIFGLAVTQARNSEKFMQAATTPQHAAETMWEATYRAQINPWLAIQPVLMRIIHPNTDPLLKNAWISGVRVEVTF